MRIDGKSIVLHELEGIEIAPLLAHQMCNEPGRPIRGGMKEGTRIHLAKWYGGGDTVNIRVLNENDVEAYRQLRLRALQLNPEAFGSTYEREATFSLEFVADRVLAAEGKFTLGAFDRQGALVGIVTFVRESGVKTAHKGNVYGMFVAPEARSRGVGKAMLLALIERAKRLDGVEQLHLAVVSANDRAHRLYEALGFRSYGVEVRALKYEGNYSDETLMALPLLREQP
ncbi:GNAT family N-acetyltransferase [Paenibacillus cymbidii]|uniref:GNAT family N-acetyltransferase n=1 Tax=Paenibacillus cymbidii TaxID=1639034 RepID=UPI001F2A5172|nr:GNAT family N-acetyltransferase [Paenibacillus cymbidii]